MSTSGTSTPPRAGWHVLTPDGVWFAAGTEAAADRSAGLESLLGQEVSGERAAPEHPRVRQLQASFGFEFEPLVEPGHMRHRAPAAKLLYRAAEYAESRARAVALRLGMPYERIDGITMVDGTSAELADYHNLISRAGQLYGDAPYAMAPPRASMRLRQTACLQKFALAREWDSARTPLPRCVFEISDSYRSEPEEQLRLGFRLRRFRLPEAHLHGRSVAESAMHARALHACYLADLAGVADELVLLVSTTAEFAERHPLFLAELVASSGSPALVEVSPPGTLCGAGIEIDVEYKVVDATGFARELSSFQIDELITRAFGIGTALAPVTTIHTPPIGSLERFVFTALDHVARAEANGGRARLPLWLSPFGFRLAWSPDDPPPAATVRELGARLAQLDVPVDVDDRLLTVARKTADADAELVPFLVLLDGQSLPDRVRVRIYETRRVEECAPADLLAQLPPSDANPRLPEPPHLLSARPVPLGGLP